MKCDLGAEKHDSEIRGLYSGYLDRLSWKLLGAYLVDWLQTDQDERYLRHKHHSKCFRITIPEM